MVLGHRSRDLGVFGNRLVALHYCACRQLLGLHVYRGYGRHTTGGKTAVLLYQQPNISVQ